MHDLSDRHDGFPGSLIFYTAGPLGIHIDVCQMQRGQVLRIADRCAVNAAFRKRRSAEYAWINPPTTQGLYPQVLKRIRDGRDLQFNFRCDSPDCRRLLQMDVRRGEDGMVEFHTSTLSEEVRQPPALSESTGGGPGGLLRACGWCKKVFVDGSWLEVEEAVARLQLFHQSVLPAMTHGICQKCFQAVSASLADS